MGQATTSLLTSWANFYVIIGSSAGALTGLQFVIMTLIAQLRPQSSMQEIRAFGTPTVVHFCAALLISAVMSAPWHGFRNMSYCLGTCGAAGMIYAVRIIWHARKSVYNPDVEDWIWYTALPLIAYTGVLAAAILLWWQPAISLRLIAVTTLLFLFVGIHNAWDTITYITTQSREEEKKPDVSN